MFQNYFPFVEKVLPGINALAYFSKEPMAAKKVYNIEIWCQHKK